MNGRYAQSTSVSVEKSMEEIKSTLRKYGADGVGSYERQNKAMIQFEFKNLVIQMAMVLPDRDDDEFTKTPTGKDRSDSAATAAYDQEVRARWRALLLVVKAKLEAVETGIATVEQEFLAYIMTPNGSVGDLLIPQIESAASSGKLKVKGLLD